ncbi:hypothetical protein [uncultured Psychromonas sp.]|uniref:hypothetical protein n=1 Tax=uncultured Psychromonas sp. TaxID=173974 RepID=UPI002611790D|nr:hypothetical protein [uncultured Psychromonas sp.]
MSLENYNKLQAHSQDDLRLLGNGLPTLMNAGLDILSEQLSTEKMLEKIKAIIPTQGWVMYRDQVEISADIPTRTDLIEGEWVNESDSLKVKLVSTDLFQVTRMNRADADGFTAFSEQKVVLRQHLKNNITCAVYRCWWKQAQEGEQKGRWLPLTQQFIGFSNEKEQA